MRTREMLSRALNQAQGFNRASDLVPLLNDVQNMLTKHECAQTLYIDSSTGRPPLIQTQAGVFEYDSNTTGNAWMANCFRISVVLREEPIEVDYNLRLLGNTTEFVEINGRRYFPYQYTYELDELPDVGARIGFSRDPGDTTGEYYAQAYRNPATQIVSDRIQLSIPDVDGAHSLIVLPTLIKRCEAQLNGNYIEFIAFVEQIRPKLWAILSKGAQGKRHKSMPRHA